MIWSTLGTILKSAVDILRRVAVALSFLSTLISLFRLFCANPRLTRLSSFECLTRLSSFQRLMWLSSFERLTRLSSFERLMRLSSFERLTRLSSFKRLTRLSKFKHLTRLSSFERLTRLSSFERRAFLFPSTYFCLHSQSVFVPNYRTSPSR